MPFIEQLAQQTASGAAAGILGLALGKYNDRRQLAQQGKLQAQQIAGSKELTDYQYQKQLQMWKDTNYQAQMEELRKAGLNPGLIYGMSGGGGTTAGTGGANVEGASAQQGGGGEIQAATAAMGMGLNSALMNAQIKVMESQANLNNTEAQKKGGIDTEVGKATLGSILQNTKNAEIQAAVLQWDAKLKQLEHNYKQATNQDSIEIVRQQYRKLEGEATSALVKANIDTNTRATVEAQIERNFIKTGVEIALIRANTELSKAHKNLTEAQITQISESISQKWVELAQNGQKLTIEAFKAEFEANYPGIWNVLGNAAQEALHDLQKGLDPSKNEYRHKIK